MSLQVSIERVRGTVDMEFTSQALIVLIQLFISRFTRANAISFLLCRKSLMRIVIVNVYVNVNIKVLLLGLFIKN